MYDAIFRDQTEVNAEESGCQRVKSGCSYKLLLLFDHLLAGVLNLPSGLRGDQNVHIAYADNIICCLRARIVQLMNAGEPITSATLLGFFPASTKVFPAVN